MSLPNPILIVQLLKTDGWETAFTRELKEIIITIGRSSDCDISISQLDIDRKHKAIVSSFHMTLARRSVTAKIGGRYIEPGYTLKDGFDGSPSRNGCYVNGKRVVDKHELIDGDVISISLGFQMLYNYGKKKSPTVILDDTLIDPSQA